MGGLAFVQISEFITIYAKQPGSIVPVDSKRLYRHLQALRV